ncbi:hypothetical protein ACIOFV_19770 [Streptomyces mirabilis]|uniref:hypothetical protein n=1 Tax=Streptomyces mirabilis TaxID=68239 RepID=UPI0038066C74
MSAYADQRVLVVGGTSGVGLATAGEFDHVVVSAGEAPMGRADALPLADAYAAMDSKFWGAYRIARSVRVRPSGSLTAVLFVTGNAYATGTTVYVDGGGTIA